MEINNELRNEPKLQPPGAGLPLLQRILLRGFYGPILSQWQSPKKCRKDYELLVNKLIEKISAIPKNNRKTRALIDPLPGLEDSSRFWSLNGVLEHLLIVSKGMEGAILSLSAGRIPPGKADTAKVKPKNLDKDCLDDYIKYAPELLKRIDEKITLPGMNFNSRLKFYHPWLGAITAKQWYWLLSTHQSIHYRQAKAIISHLKI